MLYSTRSIFAKSVQDRERLYNINHPRGFLCLPGLSRPPRGIRACPPGMGALIEKLVICWLNETLGFLMTKYTDHGRMSTKNQEISGKARNLLITPIMGRLDRLETYWKKRKICAILFGNTRNQEGSDGFELSATSFAFGSTIC